MVHVNVINPGSLPTSDVDAPATRWLASLVASIANGANMKITLEVESNQEISAEALAKILREALLPQNPIYPELRESCRDWCFVAIESIHVPLADPESESPPPSQD